MKINSKRVKKYLYLNEVSHQSVLQQVRKQLAVELLDRAEKVPERRHELYDFLGFEPVQMTPDIFNRMAKFDSAAFVIGHFRSPFIVDENPWPVLTGIRLRAVLKYGRDFLKFFYMKLFLQALRKSLVFNEELRAMQFFSSQSRR